MKFRTPSLILVALLGWAHVAGAQSVGAGGSLTVLSRPSGASLRISGEQVVVGRTPMTLARGMIGRYEVRSNEPGYSARPRVIQLSGVSADTLWMTLQPKSAAAAGLRSLVIPGWGQFYGSRGGAGAAFLTAGLLGGAAVGVFAIRYNDRRDAADAATARYTATPTAITLADKEHADGRLDDARQQRGIAVGVAAGIWGLSAIDAVVHFPRVSGGALALGPAAGVGGNDLASLASLTWRF